MSLHDKIMNLHNIRENMELGRPDECLAYKVGHRDARHAAAELAVEQDAFVDELVAALKALVQTNSQDYDRGMHGYAQGSMRDSQWFKARAVLAKLEQTK